ncbi:MAG: HD domain-containing protein [Treponema sp.]|nr:HD domain-containing protein [Treponema sp.]
MQNNQINTTPIKQPEDPFSAFYISSGLERLDRQMKFIAEIDKMTHILRQTLLVDGTRRENDAEHSWHLAVMAQILPEYAAVAPNIDRAIRMVLVHDLIEIYAGDTFAYDEQGAQTKKQRESEAAEKLFSILPDDQNVQIKELWIEFDEKKTDDALFANCLDSLQPFLHNTLTQGHSWQEHHVKKSHVLKRIGIVQKAMPAIWPWVIKNLDHAVEQGWLLDE